MRKFIGALSVITVLMVTACGGGGGGSTTAPPPPPPPPPPATVIISGTITFDFVPHNTATSGLDYDNIQARPVRGVPVEVVDSSGAVLASDTTDDSGNYSVSVSSNTNVRVQAKAQLLQTTGAKWDVRVTDNTSGDALYTLAGTLTSSGAANSTRNLNAGSGWGGTSYTGTRASAPFAIISPIYDTLQKFSAVDNAVDFPVMEFRWSTRNKAAVGDRANGDIGTSSYVSSGGTGNVYILGDANNDTDEHDTHVVVHEWGHYFEDRLSRSDSIGGSHGGGDRLDPRVAFGEGWGNALSGMITDDPFYRDSLGNQQASGFSINVENNTNTNPGWFSEGSVQSILYDLYDSTSDGADVISLGLGPIYEALTAASYTDTPVFTTIFSFSTELKAQQAGSIANIDALLAAQTINGTGAKGIGETNTGGIARSLPVYKSIVVNGATTTVCSVNDAGTSNKLSNREYTELEIATTGTYTITMTRTSGAAARDPDFFIWKAGVIVQAAQAAPAESETFTGTLQAGSHIIETLDFQNNTPANSGDSCYSLVVTG